VQAISGALIGGGCTLLAFKFARQAYEHLESHPPAHDLPMHLDSEVNQLMLTVVAGFGGLVVCMFGVSCVGLGLLSVQLLKAPKTPPNAP
jgi:Na+/phosphate symporter